MKTTKLLKNLAIDQYGEKWYFESIADLRKQIPGKCSKMYHDVGDKSIEIGRVIGKLWLTFYAPIEKEI